VKDLLSRLLDNRINHRYETKTTDQAVQIKISLLSLNLNWVVQLLLMKIYLKQL